MRKKDVKRSIDALIHNVSGALAIFAMQTVMKYL